MRTRSTARTEAVAVPSVGGVRLLARAVKVHAGDLERLAAVATQRGNPIFNPDERRLQQDLPPSDDVVRRLVDALCSERLMHGRVVGPAVVLHSLAGCARQPMHTDYDAAVVARCAAKPLGALLALEDGTRLCVVDGEVEMRVGDVLVFDGDVPHCGAPYDSANTRIHIFLDSPGVRRVHNATYPFPRVRRPPHVKMRFNS